MAPSSLFVGISSDRELTFQRLDFDTISYPAMKTYCCVTYYSYTNSQHNQFFNVSIMINSMDKVDRK